MKKILAILTSAVLVVSLAACSKDAADYPSRPINNVIPFGAGGGTDVWNRAIMSELGKDLGATITSSNMTGGSAGSIGVNYGWESKHDGYTLVGTSETPLTIPVQTGLKQTAKDWTFFIAAGRITSYNVCYTKLLRTYHFW